MNEQLIISAACKACGITEEALMSRDSRQVEHSTARAIIAILLRDMGYRIVNIQRVLHYKNHTSVLHALRGAGDESYDRYLSIKIREVREIIDGEA